MQFHDHGTDERRKSAYPGGPIEFGDGAPEGIDDGASESLHGMHFFKSVS